MSNLLPHMREIADAIRNENPNRAARRAAREIRPAIEREHGRGLVIAARLNAGAHAARAALMNTGMLSKDEELLLQFAPLGDARFKAIVDAFAIYAAGEVGRL